MDLLTATLLWRHLTPTSPDSLGCHPYTDDDPFYINKLPNVYFYGNSKDFSTKLILNEKNKSIIRLITIPKFYESKTIVLVNIETLDSFEIRIN